MVSAKEFKLFKSMYQTNIFFDPLLIEMILETQGLSQNLQFKKGANLPLDYYFVAQIRFIIMCCDPSYNAQLKTNKQNKPKTTVLLLKTAREG